MAKLLLQFKNKIISIVEHNEVTNNCTSRNVVNVQEFIFEWTLQTYYDIGIMRTILEGSKRTGRIASLV